MEWIQNNWLAFYGAVVGTIALFLNFARFLLMYQKSARKLRVHSAVDSAAQSELDRVHEPFSGNLLGPVYKVIVTNVGHVPMHIQDAGLLIKTDSNFEKLQAYTRDDSNYLITVDDSGGVEIPAGSKKSFPIWLRKGQAVPEVVGCFAISQLGREYKGKHDSEGIKLKMPN